MDSTPSAGRLAIRCVRPELIPAADRARIEHEMTALGTQLGRVVDRLTVEIDPTREGPWVTVANAIGRTHATDVIVPDLEHVDGIDHRIRERVQLITVKGEQVLERLITTTQAAPA